MALSGLSTLGPGGRVEALILVVAMAGLMLNLNHGRRSLLMMALMLLEVRGLGSSGVKKFTVQKC